MGKKRENTSWGKSTAMESRSEQRFSLRQSLHKGLDRAKKHMHFHSSKSAVSTSVNSAEPVNSPGPDPGSETNTGSTSSEHVSLWDQAYDLLKEEKPKVLLEYECILSRVAVEGKSTSIERAQDTENFNNIIPQSNTAERRKKLQQIAESSFKKMQEGKLPVTFFGKEIVWQEAIGKVGNGIEWVQKYAKDALKDVPYAPAVMACTSLLLPLLTSPSKVDDENNKGFLYVSSQIRYYIAMETRLLPDILDADTKAELKDQLKGLYKLVIDYQVQSVMKFNRNAGKNYVRSVVDYDDWSGQLKVIQEKEETIDRRFLDAKSGLNVQYLHDLNRKAEESRGELRDIANYAQIIEQRISDAEKRRLRETLKAPNPSLEKQSLEKRKGGLLKDSYRWVVENGDFNRWKDARSGQLLWVKGEPGKGKTMLLCGIIDELSRIPTSDTNIAFFFCRASEESLNTSSAVLRGLIFMLVTQQPSLMSHFEDSFDGHNSWFALENTLTRILNDPNLHPTYFVIDGLDECIGDRQYLLELLVEHSAAHEKVKWLVSSRNWLEIEQDLDRATRMELQLELNEEILSKAVHLFIEYKVEKLANESPNGNRKPEVWKDVKDYLLTNANGTFLWVALVCEDLVRVSSRHVLEKVRKFPPGLENIYARMMSQISDSDDSETCKSILGLITTVLRPITLDEMKVYIEVPGDTEDALELVRLCGSFLSVQDNTIFLIHQSAKDFLMRDELSSRIYPYGKEAVHFNLFSKSLHFISKTLRRNVYDLDAPGYPIEQVQPPNPDPLVAVRYACVYWVDHIICSSIDDIKRAVQGESSVYLFLCEYYLYWLEAMSIFKSIPGAIASMQKLEKLITKWTYEGSESLISRVRDAIRFVQYTKVAIENSPLQVYHSSLVFSPMKSITRLQYHDREIKRDWIRKVPLMEESWSQCLQTLEGHNDGVISIAWSQDGSRLASMTNSSARIWNLGTNDRSLVLEVDGPSKSSIWWLDDTQVAVLSKTAIEVWNIATRQSKSMFENHSLDLSCMAWSCDRRRLALASDKSIWISDPATATLGPILEGHAGAIWVLAWSPDGSQLASGSKDGATSVWDMITMECIRNFPSSEWIRSIAWSPDSSRFASSSTHASITVWDTKTWDSMCFHGHKGWVEAVAWSPDGSQIASGSYDKTVRVWDARTAECTVILWGHSARICSLSWSPDGRHLASGSDDTTVKIWDTTIKFQSTNRGHNEPVQSITWVQDGTQVVSESMDTPIRLWDPTTGQCTIFQHQQGTQSKFFGNDDGNKLASTLYDGDVHVWDPITGQDTVCRGHGYSVTDIAWSPDGVQLASSSYDETVRVWNPTTGCEFLAFTEHTDVVDNIAWSPNGSQVASASRDYTVRVWNSTTGREVSICKEHTDKVSTVSWSYDGAQLASASDYRIVISDPTTGQCILNSPIETPGFLRFNSTYSDLLHTGLGMFDVEDLQRASTSSNDSNYVPQPHGYGLSGDLSWITYDGTKILWLPPEHRPARLHALALSATTVTIGCVSGIVEFYEFSAEYNGVIRGTK